MKWYLQHVMLLLLIHCLIIKGQIIVTPPAQTTILENVTMIEICLNITGNESMMFTVNIIDSPIDNQATNFSLSATSLSIDPMVNESSCFTVNITNNEAVEQNKFINLTLSSPDMDVDFIGNSVIIEIQDDDAVTLTQVPLTSDNITEGGANLMICYEITNGTLGDISLITLEVSDFGTTAKDSDYSIVSSWIDGSMFCCDLRAEEDNVFEGTETINFTISSSINSIMINGSYRTLYIIDTTVLPVTLLNDSVTLMEGESGDLCFSITGIDIETATDFSLTKSSGNDDLSVGDPVTISNATNVTRCITVVAINDTIPEGVETFMLTWINSDNKAEPDPLTVTVTIVGHLIPSLGNNTTVSVTEGQTLVFCVRLDGMATEGIIYNYTTLTDTASNGDFTPTSGMVQIAVWGTMGCSSIDITDNNEVDGTRNFTVVFSESSISSMIVNIIDNDVGCIGFSQSTITISEIIGSYTFQLESTCGTITTEFNVLFTYENGTAISGRDFSIMATNPISWPVSSPPSITVNIIDNTVVNNDRTFYLILSVPVSVELDINVTVPQLQLTITNNDASVINTPSMVTYNSTGEKELCYYHTNQIVSSISYAISYTATDGSATAGRDYSLPDGSIQLPLDSSDPICIRIQIYNPSMMTTRSMFTITWTVDDSLFLLRFTNTTVIIDISLPIPSTTTTTTLSPPTSTSLVSSTTPTAASPTGTTSSGFAGLGIYPIIGIIVGVVAAGVVCLLLLVCVVCCVKVRMNRQGFYTTNEDKGEAPQMLRYSASLRSLQSQTVMPADSREKENEYMV